MEQNIIKLSSPETHEFWKIPILYEDGDLLALDKPARLLSSPDRYDADRPNLMKLLHRDIARGAPWAVQHQITYLANAHRLDFETTGVMLLAKTKPVLIELANQFGSLKPVKTYRALVHGQPAEDKFSVEAKLGQHPTKLGIVRVDEKRGKKALTDFEVVERFSRYALLLCQPATGRTHQIRVHLQWKKLPLVADRTYGGRPLYLSNLKLDYREKKDQPEQPLLGRVALHAESLTLTHPVQQREITIASPLPKDMQVALKYLRRYGIRKGIEEPSIPIPLD